MRLLAGFDLEREARMADMAANHAVLPAVIDMQNYRKEQRNERKTREEEY